MPYAEPNAEALRRNREAIALRRSADAHELSAPANRSELRFVLTTTLVTIAFVLAVSKGGREPADASACLEPTLG